MKRLLCFALVSAAAIGCSAPVERSEENLDSVDTASQRETIAPQWWGNGSQCNTIAPHSDIWLSTQISSSEERGVEVPLYQYGQTGCEWAYIIDYHIDNWPGANWYNAFIHIAPRQDLSTEAACRAAYTNLRVYGYPGSNTWQNQAGYLLYEESMRGTWNSSYHGCNFNFPADVTVLWYGTVRVVSQDGQGFMPLSPHYSYWVSHT